MSVLLLVVLVLVVLPTSSERPTKLSECLSLGIPVVINKGIGDTEKMQIAINLTRITFPFLFFVK